MSSKSKILNGSHSMTMYKNGERKSHSKKDLEEIKLIIQKKLEVATLDYNIALENISKCKENGTDDTSPTFKGADESDSEQSKFENSLRATTLSTLIKDLKNALIRIETKSYGICRITGELIEIDRLRAAPHATLSVYAKKQMGE